ncbi:hypothetical protein GRI39_09125 [Altererythrobacter indicus]|uniref:Uncharacterized protein n=1 Tax=Altericroceibacterium indicum TaxID=374177 RepID=A0A845ACB4_9SPHN|nr:hypothetical protein [Altericroceibacterium indicum]MXP26196.1 hypothetical protein [Altericroceibacterium indicum]
MIKFYTALTASLCIVIATPASAQQGEAKSKLTLQDSTLMRCSAAFAMVSSQQDDNDADAKNYPPLNERGREYFVRAMAEVMDHTGLDRAGIVDLLRAQMVELAKPGKLDEAMPPCLLSLESTGL